MLLSVGPSTHIYPPSKTNLPGGKSHSPPPTTTAIMAKYESAGSSTCVIEPIQLQEISTDHLTKPQDAILSTSQTSLRLANTKGIQESDDIMQTLPSPTTQAAERLERWNASRSTVYKILAAFWSFVVMGSNDAAYGALIPYVSQLSPCIYENNAR